MSAASEGQPFTLSSNCKINLACHSRCYKESNQATHISRRKPVLHKLPRSKNMVFNNIQLQHSKQNENVSTFDTKHNEKSTEPRAK